MSSIGLVLRDEKCEAFSQVPVEDWSLPISLVTGGTLILGTPIGSDEFVSRSCAEIVSKEKSLLNRIPLLGNLQVSSLLLHYCGVSKMTHLLRSVAPSLIRDAANDRDVNVLRCFESIVGFQLNSIQARQLEFRIAKGGFGLQSATQRSHQAFLGAWALTLSVLPRRLPSLIPDSSIFLEASPSLLDGHVHHSLDVLRNSYLAISETLPYLSSLAERPSKLQSRLTRVSSAADFDEFIQSLNRRDKARLRSCSGAESGLWLDAVRSSQHLMFSNAEFQLACLLRLGAAIPAMCQLDHCEPKCNHEVDNFGYHVMTCQWRGGPIHRHDAITDVCFQMLKAVDLRARKEVLHQFSDKRRPDIVLFDWSQSRPLLLDISVIHPWMASVFPATSNSTGHAAADRDKLKNTKYLTSTASLGYDFKPLSFEVFGRWSPVVSEFCTTVASRAFDDHPADKAEFLHYWRRRLSVCIQKENADIILKKLSSILRADDSDPIPQPADSYVRWFVPS